MLSVAFFDHAEAIINLWLKEGFTGVGGIHWLFLQQLSKNYLDPLFEKVFQEALDNIALYPPHRQKFINDISSGGSAATSLSWHWILLDPYPEEMIETMITKQEQLHPGARDFILGASRHT